jgi:DNA-binding response OmpR family regulator
MNPLQVLLVDDDPVIRNLLRFALEHAGFSVLDAANADEGLALFERNISTISIVVSDLAMTGMNGIEMVDCILKVAPNVPVLFISGFYPSYQDSLRGFPCLPKPFAPSELVKKVSTLLSGSKRNVASK